MMKPKTIRSMPGGKRSLGVLMMCMASTAMMYAPGASAVVCDGTITANVVVLDSPTVFNRLGAQNPNFITYSLRRDVVQKSHIKRCTAPGVDGTFQAFGNCGTFVLQDAVIDETTLAEISPATCVLDTNAEVVATPIEGTDGVLSCPSAGSEGITGDNVPGSRPGFGESAGGILLPGNVEQRRDKRPRPLVVRSAAEQCLTVNFQNLLAPVANPNNDQQPPDNLINNDQVADRCASFHASGAEVLNSINSDGSLVGQNGVAADAAVRNVCGAGEVKGGLVGPGGSITYELYTPKEGTFIINSYGATIGSEANGGNLGLGMFGQLNVQPKGAKFYRSQMTEEEMRLATRGKVASDCTWSYDAYGNKTPDGVHGVDCNPGGQPIIDYEAKYPNDCQGGSAWRWWMGSRGGVWCREGKAGLPIVNMVTASGELVHSDINAIITGPNADGSFPPSTYPLESVGKNNPAYPNRLEPFREFSSIYHDEQATAQVFPRWYADPVLHYTLAGVKDAFMINYGSGGIGSEIIANRLHTGPMHDCTDCAYEEFFLASQTVGDPGMLVEFPANTGIAQCDPTAIAGPTCWRDPVNLANGPIRVQNRWGRFIENQALYQEDPSNVHHSYTGDAVKIRNIHAGAFEQHIFHLHNLQWLHNPNDDNSNYLDAQEIMPGSGHTYELVNGGAGNRNKTSGDAIFHCHFYPHFAQGMWYHIRIHDVMETGTVLRVSGGRADRPRFHRNPFALRSGRPARGARALPDGELPDGSPIPAIVPLPGKAMPQMPANVRVIAVDRGKHSILGGRTGKDGIPDSSQARVDRRSAAGADGILGTKDDVSPGFPFWLAGNECGTPTATDPCPQGIVGQRMPTPPLDMLTAEGAPGAGYLAEQAGGWDGGLPRHALQGYVSGGLSADTNSRLDFRKIIELGKPVYFPEVGTDMEKLSMTYQSVRNRPSAANTLVGNGTTTGSFVLNGAPPVPGGPFNDPCIDDAGVPLTANNTFSWFDGDGNAATLNTKGGSQFGGENPRTYKIANVQIDAVFNKVGYHYPQERIISLWEDVAPTILKQRPPEPLVMRFNTFDCGKILHSNLVPSEFELDDYQVRTPTDIIGQHIHLPKWDLTTNDGAANGWNYEDGSLSPQMVQERIHAINEFNHFAGTIIPALTLPGQLAPIDLTDMQKVPTIDTGDTGGTPAGLTTLAAALHPFFGVGVAGQDHLGARTTIQRILIDPVVNVAGVDRGLGLTFSHDHYGPSTFQQIGLYSTILAEPAGSTWVHNESGEVLGTRADGGPTTWQAAILPPASAPNGSTVQSENVEAHREFYFEMSDFQHAYEAGVYVGADANGVPVHTLVEQPDPFNAQVAFAPGIRDAWEESVNPPLKLKSVPFPDVVTAEGVCPGPITADPMIDANGNVVPGGFVNGQGITNASPFVPRPCAEAINISHSSMWVVNYRNEPIGLRVFDPNATGPDGQNGSQAAGDAGDLALALQTRIDRKIADLNTSFGKMPYPAAAYCDDAGDGINCDRNPGDPVTPIMRAYERDQIKVKIQVGATEEQHQATIHGMKWLSNGSGFGRSGNSGWRNFQSHGISEQFSLQTPVNPDPGQTGGTVDYLYAQDATRDGMWSGTWGLIRTYGAKRGDLVELPNNALNPAGAVISNAADFTDPATNESSVCPNDAPITSYKVVAVLANDVLPNNLGVTIPQLGNVDPLFPGGVDPVTGVLTPATTFGQETVGGPLDPNGGTLVYNRRMTVVPDVILPAEGAEPAANIRGGQGPLNDPTAIMYVHEADLVATDALCTDVTNLACDFKLDPEAPVEPIVLRANAGDCVDVILVNRLRAAETVATAGADGVLGTADDGVAEVPNTGMPDLAGWQDMMWVVKRRVQVDPVTGIKEMHFFNNNLIRPSGLAGLHPQLVEYDMSKHDGVVVGGNSETTVARPGTMTSYQWYAGDLAQNKVGVDATTGADQYEIVATPIEFGAVNLVSADRVKQPQKGMFGSLVIEPADAIVAEDTMVPDGQGTANALGEEPMRLTRAQVTVTSAAGDAGSGGDYREALSIGHKITNLRWSDGAAIANINQGELGREGAEDSGHAGFNYGMEPSWFRFKLPPDVPFGAAGAPNSYGSIPNAHAMYANGLVAGEPNSLPNNDPATPVFTANAGQATRMYVLNGASADRDGVFILHGHLWQREPFVCTGLSQDDEVLLPGRCDPDAPVPSLALGNNPQAKYMGGEEGMGHVFTHWPLLFNAGGSGLVGGDYLYRDYAPNGNRNGQFGILRVEGGVDQRPPAEPCFVNCDPDEPKPKPKHKWKKHFYKWFKGLHLGHLGHHDHDH